MPTIIDETELARLEALAGKASKMPFFPDGFDVQDDFDQTVCRCNWVNDLAEDVQEANTHYIAAACNDVPALVAEVRRLRRNYECSEKSLQRHEHMVAELMEKVEAWEWLVEVEGLFRHSLYRKSYWRWRSGAYDELAQSLIAAREAVHADRE